MGAAALGAVYALVARAARGGSRLRALIPVDPTRAVSLRTGRNRSGDREAIPKRVDLRSLFSGVAFVGRNPLILGALSLDLVAVLLGGATALLPIFAHTILGTGAWGLGLLRSRRRPWGRWGPRWCWRGVPCAPPPGCRCCRR